MLIDTTLREGAQTYGVYFDTAAKREIVKLLARAGVEEIEAGWAGQEGLAELLAWARGLVAPTELAVWSRLKAADVELAAAAGATRLSLGVPVSDAHLDARLGTSREALLRCMRNVVPLARNRGMTYISVGLEDASRADEEFLLEAARHCARLGVDRVRLADSVGVLDPAGTARLVELVRQAFPGDIAVHCHDDFGMATANALTALGAGARWADVSVLGLGERTGVARLEEVASFLTLRRGTAAYDLHAVRKACLLVSSVADVPIPRDKPICGRDIFACESGLHAHGLLRDPALFEPFPPGAVGAPEGARQVRLGAKSGRAAVAAAMDSMGLRGAPAPAVGEAARRVRSAATALGRPLTDPELAATIGA